MKILKYPELRQTYCWDCGAKAIQSALAYYGIDVREQLVMQIAGTTKSGTPPIGLKKVAKKHQLDYKAGKMKIADVKKYIDRKIPVILLVQAWSGRKKTDWENDWDDGHYVVAIGYDDKKIYFEDPSSTVRTFLEYGELKNAGTTLVAGTERSLSTGAWLFSGKKRSLSQIRRFIWIRMFCAIMFLVDKNLIYGLLFEQNQG